MKFNLGTKRELRFSDHAPVIDTINMQDRIRETGVARDYAKKNVLEMLYGAETEERLKYHQMYGYRGHTFYENGFFSDKDTPTNICTKIEVDWPFLQHTERFLDNTEAKIAENLYDSGTHGFSWAVGGKDGGEFFPTKTAFIQGFDVVGTESFVSLEKKQMIDALGECLAGFESDQIEAIGESVIEGCSQDSTSNILFDAQTKINRLQFELEVAQLNQSNVKKRTEMIGEAFRGNNFPYIPNEIISMLANPQNPEECDKVAEFFRRASGVDTSQLPTTANLQQSRLVINKKVDAPQSTPHPVDKVFDAMPDNLM